MSCIVCGSVHVPSYLWLIWRNWEEVMLTMTRVHKGLEMFRKSNSVG